MALSLSEFSHYFRNLKNGTYKCPFCSHEAFAANIIPGSENAGVAGVDGRTELGGPPEAHFSFYSLVCLKCGRIDLFSTIQVSKWISENPLPEE